MPCEAHKSYLDEVRAKMADLLDDLAVELAVTAAAGIFSSFVTFGAGAAVATAKATSTIARYGTKISALISSEKGRCGRQSHRCSRRHTSERDR